MSEKQQNRYLYEYTIPSESDDIRTFSVVAESEEAAKAQIKERVADLEFVEQDEVEIGKLLRTLDASKQYYECEGCT